MKIKVLYLYLFLGLFSFSLSAQTIDPKVEVRRDFEGKLMEITKSKLNPVFADSLMNFNIKFDYSIFDNPIKDLYEFSPIQVESLKKQGEVRYPKLYAKIGAGFPLYTQGDIYFQHHWKRGFSLTAYGTHDGFWDKLPLRSVLVEDGGYKIVKDTKKIYADRVKNSLGMKASYAWEKGVADLGIDYSNNLFVHSGFQGDIIDNPLYSTIDWENRSNIRENLSHRYTSLGAALSVKSTNISPEGLTYKVDLGFKNTIDRDRVLYNGNHIIDENELNIGVVVGKNFKTIHRAEVEVDYQYVTGSHEFISSSYSIAALNYFEITPQYSLNLDRFILSAGVKLAVAKFAENDYAPVLLDKERFVNVAPVASVRYKLWQDYIWVYSQIGGGNRYNSHSTLLEYSPFVGFNQSYNFTSVPIDLEVGFNGGIGDRFSYNIYGGYTVAKNLPMFANIFNTGLYTYFKDLNYGTIGGELMLKSRYFTAGIEGSYMMYNEDSNDLFSFSSTQHFITHVCIPKFQGKLFGKYNHKERIFIELILNYRSSYYSYCLTGEPTYGISPAYTLAEIPSYVDMKLNLTYAINNTLSVFLEGSNLLNQDIQYWPGYFEPGIKIGGGIFLKF